jgi:signal peptide peptidase SppA
MRHKHVERYVRERPWAILPGALEAIMEILAMHELGERSPAEIEEAIKAARASNGGDAETATMRVGSTAILPIYGVIMPRASMFEVSQSGTSLETFRSELDELMRDDSVKSIVLDVNSPGGSTELLTETANELRAARTRKPIIGVANGMAASAAYHLLSQASEAFGTPSGMVGSVGVYATHQDLSAAAEKAGVKTTFIQAGKRKTEGNPFEPLSDSAKAQIQSLVDEHYGVMVSDIAAGRRVAEGTVRGEGFGEGVVFTSSAAARRGMIDGVQTFDETVATVLATGVSGRAPARVEPAAETFADAVEVALRAVDAVVTDSEALRVLSRRKRGDLAALHERVEKLLDVTEPEEDDAGVDLEGESLEAASRATERLAFSRILEGR